MKLYLYVCLICCYSCLSDKTSINFENIPVEINTSATIKVSQFLSHIEIIPLETHITHPIGNISKVQIFNNQIFVLDAMSNSIQVFNKKGKIQNILHKVGRGPGQYITLTDMQVNNEGIFIVDFSQNSILKYDFNMNYKNRIKFEVAPYQFELLNNGYLLYVEPNEKDMDHYFYSADTNGKITGKYIEAPKTSKWKKGPTYNWSSSNVFSFSNHKILSCKYGNDLYTLDNDQIKGLYSLNFGECTFPSYQDISTTKITSPDLPYALRQNILQIKNCLLIDYIYKAKRYFILYNPTTHEIKNGKVVNDLLPSFRFFPQWSTNNELVDGISAYNLLTDFPDLVKETPILNELSYDSNPVLFIYQ